MVVNNKAPESVPELLSYMLQASIAVWILHKHGIVHSDIKPSNVLFDGKRVWVIDFGGSEFIPVGVAETSAEYPRVRAHTPQFASKEVKSGQPLRFDQDVYALGETFGYWTDKLCWTYGVPHARSLIISEKISEIVWDMVKVVRFERPTMDSVVKGLDEGINSYMPHVSKRLRARFQRFF